MKITITKDGKNKTYNLPTDWNRVSIGTYMKTVQALEVNTETQELETAGNLIHALTKIPRQQVDELPVNYIKDINTNVVSLLSQPINDKLKFVIKIKGIEYGFHPKLREISLGEFVDLEQYITKGISQNMHKIMSVLYRPIVKRKGSRYQIEDYGATPIEERAELFKEEMTVGDFNGASVFFYNFATELLKFSNRYLKTLKTKTEQLKKLAN